MLVSGSSVGAAHWRAAALILFACSALAVGCGSSFRDDGGVDGADAGGARDGSPAVDGSVPDEPCVDEFAVPCECEGDALGYAYCAGGRYGACECPPPMTLPDAGPMSDAGPRPDGGDAGSTEPDAGPSTCTGDPEWCDGRDNDCDGAVDEGEPCPDATVRNTLPYDGTVYGVVSTDAGVSLYPIWPEDSGLPVIALPGGVTGQCMFSAAGDVICAHDELGFAIVEGEAVTEVATPPCFRSVLTLASHVSGDIYYKCRETLRRRDGEVVGAWTHPGFLGHRVLPDSVRVLSSRVTGDHILLSPSFSLEGGLVAPIQEWVGSAEAFVPSDVTSGDSVFVAYDRDYRDGSRREIVVFRYDGAGSTHLVRRLPVPRLWRGTALALPDGTVLRTDKVNAGRWTDVHAHLPDGTSTRIWRERDDTLNLGTLVPR